MRIFKVYNLLLFFDLYLCYNYFKGKIVFRKNDRKKRNHIMNKIRYEYNNFKIGGGGFVTGFVFHKKCPDVLYARTDIGGAYRFDFEKNEWISLIDSVTSVKPEQCYPLSLAVDENDENVLYMACGDNIKGELCISRDKGKSFETKSIPCGIHGNCMGRATGERLIKAEKNLFFASRTEGLFRSSDEGDSWEKLNVNGEVNITFVNVVQSGECRTVFAGTSGGVNMSCQDGQKFRGHSLYVSYDNGESFNKVPQPKAEKSPKSVLCGYVAQRSAFGIDKETGKRYFYVTFSQTGKDKKPDKYTCDSAEIISGKIFRYELDAEGKLIEGSAADITPDMVDSVGLSGVDFCDGMLVLSEIGEAHSNSIYISFDNGESWKQILYDLSVGKVNFTIPYMKPEYNSGRLLVHWMSDIKINPFNSDMAVFNTGTGVFVTRNLTASKKGETVEWEPLCDGMEETVHLNVYSPPKGKVKCIDIVGDLGGFAFSALDEIPENSFSNENGDRYITCLNADFTDENPEIVAATPRGNWTGQTIGGIIISHDQCKTWRHLGFPYGLSDKIDRLCDNIKNPNVDSGWVAISADGKRIVWAIAQRNMFFTDTVVYTDDEGETWSKAKFIGDRDYEENPVPVYILADRVNPDIFMAVNKESMMFISQDKGRTFYECTPSQPFEKIIKRENLHLQNFEVRAESGKEKTLWVSFGTAGLWRLEFDEKTKSVNCVHITKPNDFTLGVGLGKPKDGESVPTIFTSGVIDGQYGFWRSCDYGKSFDLISEDNQHFGTVISISGDPREFGTFYIATGSRGLIYGREVK